MIDQINIVLPMAAGSEDSESKKNAYPKPLIEVGGVPMIQRVVDNLKNLGGNVRFVFVVLKEDCLRFHLDNTLSLVTGNNCMIVRLEKPTKGAACSVLMTTKFINNEGPLIIANSDQVFECDLRAKLEHFVQQNADAGCLCIHSVHPRWSYVRLENDLVVEAAEKNPISNNAIAGFYYYKEGRMFVQAATKTILNGSEVGGNYYVAPVFNEMLLDGKKIVAGFIDEGGYYSFYTPKRIEDFERR